MASMQDAQQLTKSLEELVGQLRSELENGKVDFEKLVSLSDEISERADGMAETFNTVNDTLMERLQQVGSGSGGKSARKETAKSASGGSNG